MVSKDPSATRRPATELVHRGRDPHSQHGFVNTPVYRGSTVLFPDLKTLESGEQRYTYGRKGSPSMSALEEALVHLEEGAACFLAPSGLSAVTMALMAFVQAGDHMLVADTVYQPTRRFTGEVLSTLGVEIEFYDPLLGADVAKLIRPSTKVIYAESSWLADVRGAGSPGHCRRRQGARPLHARRQYLGDTPVLEAADAWRRRRHSCRHQVHRWPRRCQPRRCRLQ